jgi:uncharacterized protein (DUF4415 family)
MKKQYDFSKGTRGVVVSSGLRKTRIAIRLDDEVLTWFRREVHKAGGGNYQTLINRALREYINQSTVK